MVSYLMGEQSKIQWTDHTFNPWEGCQKVAPECDHCYAEAMNIRFKGGANWGAKAPRRRTSAQNWNKPSRWNAQADAFFRVHGRRQRVFCASLADVFDNAINPAWRADLWALIQECDRLDWLLLTKRPQNITKMLPLDWDGGWPHVWLGTSAGTQKTADQNIPHLLAVPAAVRFVSAEPLLEAINLTNLMGKATPHRISEDGSHEYSVTIDQSGYNRLDWVICGGESGPSARPMHPDWARSLRDQCRDADVPFFFKQWGNWAVEIDRDNDDPDWRADYKKAKPNGWVILNFGGGCAFYHEKVCLMKRSAKDAAGRQLDGQEWNEFPNGRL